MSQVAVRPFVANVTIAAVALAAVGAWTTMPAQAAGGVQVTKKEYSKVELGMKWPKVKRIVDSKGKTTHTEGNCFVKEFRGWNDQTVYFKFDDNSDSGTVALERKDRIGPLGGIPPICPHVV